MDFVIISAEVYFKINPFWFQEIQRLWDTMIFVHVNHVTSLDVVLMSWCWVVAMFSELKKKSELVMAITENIAMLCVTCLVDP